MDYAAARGDLGPPLLVTAAQFQSLIAADERFTGRSQSPASIRTLDGSKCAAWTTDGILSTGKLHDGLGGGCVDLGVGNDSSVNFEFVYVPTADHAYSNPPPVEMARLRDALREKIQAQQFVSSANGCTSATDVYYIHELPLIGFGSAIEYSMMFMARALTLGKQLVFGPHSSLAWTSGYFCGRHARSLSCYFNLTSCRSVLFLRDAPLPAPFHGVPFQPAVMPRRRNPLNIGLSGFDSYGSFWVSAQLAHFFFQHMSEHTSAEVKKRRATIDFVRRGAGFGSGRVIGMHIRGGDSCAARRFCPANKSVYFEQALRLRDAYGANRIVLATDDANAAALCKQGFLGFVCRTLEIDRAKFKSNIFIENRVKEHSEGMLSGSAVAIDALTDIDMLADCDMHVLVLRSAVSRLAYALAFARSGRPTPLISLQWPWGPAYHKKRLNKKIMPRGRGGHSAFDGIRLPMRGHNTPKLG